MRSVIRRAAPAAALALGLSAWTPYAAAEQIDLGGEPVAESTDPENPAELEAGLWTATLGQTALQFSYERQIEGSTVHVGVVGAPQTIDSDGLQVDALVKPEPSEPVDCGTDYDTSSSSLPFGLIGAQVIAGNDDDCTQADRVAIVISRYSSSSSADLPVAVKVVEEAPVAQAEGPPEETPELRYDPPEPTDPVDGPIGAASFEDAPVLDARGGDVTIATDIAEGTELLWRVPLEWGDQLVVGADLAALTAADAEALGYPSIGVRLRIVQPSRDSFALTESEDYSEGSYGGEEVTPLAAATFPLRYANRYFDAAPTLPGDHWVSVAVAQAPEDREALEVPVELTVSVQASDVSPPSYKDAVLAQGGGNGPDGYSAETPYLVGDGEFSAVASGNPFSPESGGGDEWWGPRRGVGLGLGVVSLTCCAVGAAWLTRRRAR